MSQVIWLLSLSPFSKKKSIFITCNSFCKIALYSTVLNADISASLFRGHWNTGISVQQLFHFQADQGPIRILVSKTIKDE